MSLSSPVVMAVSAEIVIGLAIAAVVRDLQRLN